MAIVDRNTIKEWFRTGKKPTQEQFWNWIDSFRSMLETLQVGDVEGLQLILDGLAPANHTHTDYALLDGSNITASEWLTALGLSSITNPTEATVQLLTEYLEFELTEANTQADFNIKVYELLSEMITNYLSVPTTDGEYQLTIVGGSYYWKEKSIGRSESYTITEPDLASSTITIPLPTNVDPTEPTFLYIRGLYVGSTNYVINGTSLEIDRTGIIYPIDAGDLIDFVYHQNFEITP